MKQRRIKEGVCFLVLLIFVILLMTQDKQSTAEPQAVFEAVQSAMDVDGLEVCKDERIKKEFGIDPRAFDFVGYFASDSIMEVREILLVHLSEESGERAIVFRSIQSRVESWVMAAMRPSRTLPEIAQRFEATSETSPVFGRMR